MREEVADVQVRHSARRWNFNGATGADACRRRSEVRHSLNRGCELPLSGSASQVAWAERIRRRVDEDFDRVASALRAVAAKQSKSDRVDTEEILNILQEKRLNVMGNSRAGYFICDWQEITDQISRMLARDERIQAIKLKALRRRSSMNIRPLYDRIVVKRSDEQETSRNGIIIPDSAKEKPQEGTVIAVGHGKRLDNGTLVALDVKAGDQILFGKYSGSETKLDNTEYIIIREDDILGILTKSPESVKAAGLN
jgi:chaperonin GroES